MRVASSFPAPVSGAWSWRTRLRRLDPRLAIAAILFGYLVLGFTVLGFNRGPGQAAITTAAACGFEVLLARAFKKKWIVPLSALITSFSLSILLNYAHDPFILFVPVFFAIGSKYVFTFEGRHVFNPALAGVTFSLVLSSGLITAAPAYQWNGIDSMSVFMVMLALVFLLPQVKRGALVASFLVTFTLLTALRAWIMRYHLPFETLFLGTLSSPAFFLFAFFMITDPATSPPGRRAQIKTGIALAVVDLLFHIRLSYFTFFYAAFVIGAAKLVFFHARGMKREGPLPYFRSRFVESGYYLRPLALGALALASVGFYRGAIAPQLEIHQLPFSFESVPASVTKIDPELGDALERTDPRIQHVAKWLLSVGDAVAVGDFDADGRMDLFFTFPLKGVEHRNALYRNLGDFSFERVPLPAIAAKTEHIEANGLGTAALFVDFDGDGDEDLFVAYACGTPALLVNQLVETGAPTFTDETEARGLAHYSNAMATNFIDVDRDGRLDLLVGNVLPRTLPNYDEPTPLNLFALPRPEYEGDERMFDFMHSSWHQSDNGGVNDLYVQGPDGRFVKKDSAAMGLPETMWSLALGTGDFNEDGYTDLYVANDFGPDDLYYNDAGRRFVNYEGAVFGSVGKDTYKGMNASIVDVDNDGHLDVYVSNVHHALQAEGSLLWRFTPDAKNPGRPKVDDIATRVGALNDSRFGWGAALADFDNDGWADIAQANGMVDDTIDRRYEDCPDYWYVNEKIARSPPSIHTMANKWGDIRGYCIYGKELNRLYLNRSAGDARRFVDAAEVVGMTERTNSRGMAAVDLDDDGALDLVVTHQFGPPTIYRSVWRDRSEASFIGFALEGDGERCNREALGSRVTIRTPHLQVREVQAASGFSAQSDPRVHFGLGSDPGPIDVEVWWCGGERQIYEDLAPGTYHHLRQR